MTDDSARLLAITGQPEGVFTVKLGSSGSEIQDFRTIEPIPHVTKSAGLRVRTAAPRDICPAIVAAWADLEDRALEANAYLSPHFVLPAIRHLDPAAQILIVLVERDQGSTCEIVGVGVFQLCAATKRFPLRHLVAYRSCHSYLSGLLVDQQYAAAVLQTFLDFFCGADTDWHGVEFTERAAEGPLAELLAITAAGRGLRWFEYGRIYRAILVPNEAGEPYLKSQLASRRKDHRRRMRRLSDRGEVNWRMKHGKELPLTCIDRFIELEHLGWKGQKGTSLRSRSEDERFFREMIDGFGSCGRTFFTELCVNDEIIASTSNLISGNAGFAFKLGWNPDYAKMAPGLLNEVELIRQAPMLCEALEYIDSGASQGSFIEEVWMWRRLLTSGLYATTTLGRQALAAIQPIRQFKRWLQK